MATAAVSLTAGAGPRCSAALQGPAMERRVLVLPLVLALVVAVLAAPGKRTPSRLVGWLPPGPNG